MFNQKEYRKQYNKDNSERNKEYCKKWRKEHPEYIKKYKIQRQKDNLKYHQQWKKDNPEYYKEYHKNRRKTDLKYNINRKVGGEIYKSLKRNKNGWHWEIIVGYTIKNLIEHLRKTMPDGYTWQDFLNGKLHMDHIIPISVFNFNDPEHPDFKKCWALENLCLLPAEENLRKNAKLTEPFQPALKILIKEVN